MYESPIEIMNGEMKIQVVDNVVKAVQEQQIHVDREELIKALRGERNQYQKGFNDAAKEIFAEIERLITAKTHNYVLCGSRSAKSIEYGRQYTLRELNVEIAELKNKYIGGVGG